MRVHPSVIAAGVALLALSGCAATESAGRAVSATPSVSFATPSGTTPVVTSAEATDTCWNAYAANFSAAPDRRGLTKAEFGPKADGFDVTLTVQNGETLNADGSRTPIFDLAACSLNHDGTLGGISVKYGS